MTRRVSVVSTLSAALVMVAAANGWAQQPAQGGQGRGGPPPPPQNLQILPKDIPRQELVATMRGIAQGLGVQCNYCHVQEGQGGRNDFASDEKQPKETARVMMQMTQHVNETLSTGIGKTAADVTKVQCFTCHRGKTIPEAPPPLPPPGAAAPAPGR